MMSSTERKSVSERDQQLVGALLISLDLIVMLASGAATIAIIVGMKRNLANQDLRVSTKSTHVLPLSGGADLVVTQTQQTQQLSLGRLNLAMATRALEVQGQQHEVEKIQHNASMHRARARKKIVRSQTNHSRRVQVRLAARAKVKQARVLEKCAQFASLDAESISKIVDTMVFEEVSDGTIVCQENTDSNKLYVIAEGTCTVAIQGEAITQLENLSVFGESSLFGTAKRTATVTANGQVKLLSLETAKWKSLVHSGTLSDEFVSAMRAVQDERVNRDEERRAKKFSS